MARERMVTRTVKVTAFDVMTVNLASKQVECITIEIPSVDSLTDKALTKSITECVPADHKYVMHTEVSETEVLYGMPEADFIKIAKVLPPR